MGIEPPTRTITFSSRTRSSLAWQLRLRSPISSRNKRAAGSQFELAGPRLAGVGEGALLVAKKLALGQRVGNGGTIQGDERLTAAAALIMNRLGDDFLAGAVLAADEHGQIGLGHAADDRPQGLDRRDIRRSAARLRPPARRSAGSWPVAAGGPGRFPGPPAHGRQVR